MAKGEDVAADLVLPPSLETTTKKSERVFIYWDEVEPFFRSSLHKGAFLELKVSDKWRNI